MLNKFENNLCPSKRSAFVLINPGFRKCCLNTRSRGVQVRRLRGAGVGGWGELRSLLGRALVFGCAASGLISSVGNAEYSFGHLRQQSRANACSSSLTNSPSLARSKIGFSFIFVSVSIV